MKTFNFSAHTEATLIRFKADRALQEKRSDRSACRERGREGIEREEERGEGGGEGEQERGGEGEQEKEQRRQNRSGILRQCLDCWESIKGNI